MSADLWAALFAKRPQVIKPGLDRVNAALKHVPGLATRVPGIAVGGTNGKGTTSSFLWQLLHAAGVKAGLYTSPHLQEFRERYWFDGRALTDAEVAAELDALRAALPVPVYDETSFFEVATLLAWQAFARLGSEINVMEVGLGGRFDATNAGAPLAAIITSIGLDHCEFLGNDVAGIAREKAGIMRPGAPVFWGGARAGEPAAAAALAECAAALAAPLWSLGREYDLTRGSPSCPAAPGGVGHLHLQLPGTESLTVDLPRVAAPWPQYLVDNLAKAVACFHWLMHQPVAAPWRARQHSSTPSQMTARAVAALDGPVPRPPSLTARFERREVHRAGERPVTVILDVCHNPQGAAALAAGLAAKFGGQRVAGLVSILGDKDHGAILDTLRRSMDPIVLFPATSERALRRDALAPRHQNLIWAPSLPAAWRLVTAAAADGLVVACGSVLAVGEILTFLDA
jgi:dihydrofolate synthase/folylpolyglutamate synthase